MSPFGFNPFTSNFDYYKVNYDFVTHNTDTVLTIGDLNKIHIMDISGGERAFWLPFLDADYRGNWVTFIRDGSTNLLRIWAGSSGGSADVIMNSTAGGYVECNETRDFCSLTLVVTGSGIWTNPSYGIWSTH
jgi:hypothetical protein